MKLFSADSFEVQLIGFAAVVIAFLVFQSNKRPRMLLLQSSAGILWVVHFFLLGAFTGSALNLINASRNIAYYKAGKNRSLYIPLSFAALIVTAAVFTWQGPHSLLPMTGALIGTVAFWQTKTHYIRLITVLSPSLWLIYSIKVGSYAAMTAEILMISSIALGIYRFDIKPKLQKGRRPRLRTRWS